MHASSGIRTQDPSVRAGEDGSCLRPRDHCDRHTLIRVRKIIIHIPTHYDPYTDGLRGWTAGVWFPTGVVFSLLHSVQTGCGAHPTSCAKGTGGLSPGINRLGRETDHSSPSSAEVKNGGANIHSPIRLRDVTFYLHIMYETLLFVC
jgi:hypothetical protein